MILLYFIVAIIIIIIAAAMYKSLMIREKEDDDAVYIDSNNIWNCPECDYKNNGGRVCKSCGYEVIKFEKKSPPPLPKEKPAYSAAELGLLAKGGPETVKEPNKVISPWYILHYKFNDMGITYIFHNISVCFVDDKKPDINKVKNYACENQEVNIVISSDDPADINAVEVYTTNNIYLGYIDGKDYSWATTGLYRERLKYLLHDYIKRGFPVKAGIVKAEENDIRLNIGLYTPETEREFKEEKTFSLFSTTAKMQSNLYNYASENDEVIFNYDDEKERWVFYLEDYSCNNELEIGFAPKDQLYLLKDLSEFSIQYYAEITKIKESESGKYQVEIILKYY